MDVHLFIVTLGGLLGGFVSGFAGFGTALTTIGIFLTVLSPAVAATLVLVCSVASQMQTLPRFWHAIEPGRVLPFIVPGLMGVPLGTALLPHIEPRLFKLAVGVFLMLFTVYMLARSPPRSTWGGRSADAGVGLASGVLGGLAGLSGVLPIVWSGIRGWDKEQARAVFQAFNLSILGSALVAHALSGLVTSAVGWAALAALPGTLIGSRLGLAAYARVGNERFRQIVLGLIGASGLMLVIGNL